jgi:hypothetical protein
MSSVPFFSPKRLQKNLMSFFPCSFPRKSDLTLDMSSSKTPAYLVMDLAVSSAPKHQYVLVMTVLVVDVPDLFSYNQN